MTQRRFLFYHFGRGLTFAGLGVLALLSGCTTGGQNGSANNTNGASGATGNILRYALTSEPTTLDPATVQDGTTIDLLLQVFEGLVRWSPKNEIEPNLAEKWETSADGKTYTFHLKHGVKFHNGREMTADDFKFSMERACDPDLKSTTVTDYLRDIVGVKERLERKATDIPGIKVIDPSTLQITIDKLRPYWIGNMTYPCAFVVCKEAVTMGKEMFDEKPAIGTGPFKITGFQRGSKVTLTAFADYHQGKPKLDGIERPIIKDGATRINSYASGALDIVDVSPRDLDRVNSDAKLKPDLKEFTRARIWYLSMNQDAEGSPFKNLNVRLAFAHAIDKAETIRLAVKDKAVRADGMMPQGVLGYSPNIKPLAFDPSKAKEYLAKAGYPNGAGLSVADYDLSQRSATGRVRRRSFGTADQNQFGNYRAAAPDGMGGISETAHRQNGSVLLYKLGGQTISMDRTLCPLCCIPVGNSPTALGITPTMATATAIRSLTNSVTKPIPRRTRHCAKKTISKPNRSPSMRLRWFRSIFSATWNWSVRASVTCVTVYSDTIRISTRH